MTDPNADETPDLSLRSAEQDCARLRAHMRRLEALALRLHDEAREAEAGFARRRAALDTWVTETEGRMAGIEAENTNLRNTIAELHSSTSWRLTAPLRWLRLRLP